MKAARFLVVFLILFGFPVIAPASQKSSSQAEFPDLLQDESNENDVDDPTVKLGIRDPLEPMNRVIFKFNDKLYDWVLKPTTDAYIWLLPHDLRDCFGNFFINMASPVTLINALLQGDFALTGNVISRFLINSTIGVYGFVDVAADEFNIDLERADFGQTLGVWGLTEGIYICLPLFGPSSVRDSVGFGVDAYLHPVPYFHNNRVLDLAYYTTNKINTLSLHPDLYEDLRRYALDPYVGSRQAYYEYRKALIDRR
jgi:phospholipid-binding lipoprotein MlaA